MSARPAGRAEEGWRFHGWWGIVLAAFLIIWTSNGLTTGGITAFDPYLIDALGVERGALKRGDAIRLLVSAVLTVGTGWLADRYGVRPVMLVGIFALAGSFFGLSRVDSLLDVYVLRGLMGLSLGNAPFPSLYTWIIEHGGWRDAADYASLTPLALLPRSPAVVRNPQPTGVV